MPVFNALGNFGEVTILLLVIFLSAFFCKDNGQCVKITVIVVSAAALKMFCLWFVICQKRNICRQAKHFSNYSPMFGGWETGSFVFGVAFNIWVLGHPLLR